MDELTCAAGSGFQRALRASISVDDRSDQDTRASSSTMCIPLELSYNSGEHSGPMLIGSEGDDWSL